MIEKTAAMLELEQQRKEKIEQEEKAREALEQAIPKPTGYHILIALPNVEETFGESMLLKAE